MIKRRSYLLEHKERKLMERVKGNMATRDKFSVFGNIPREIEGTDIRNKYFRISRRSEVMRNPTVNEWKSRS
jgi:hypothetical protein